MLSLAQGAGERHLHRVTNSLFERYLRETSQDRENFSGVDLSELDIVEGLFEVAINVYSIDKDSQAILVRRSIAVNFVGLEDLADIRTLEYILNSYALAKGLHCEVSPGEVRCI